MVDVVFVVGDGGVGGVVPREGDGCVAGGGGEVGGSGGTGGGRRGGFGLGSGGNVAGVAGGRGVAGAVRVDGARRKRYSVPLARPVTAWEVGGAPTEGMDLPLAPILPFGLLVFVAGDGGVGRGVPGEQDALVAGGCGEAGGRGGVGRGSGVGVAWEGEWVRAWGRVSASGPGGTRRRTRARRWGRLRRGRSR